MVYITRIEHFNAAHKLYNPAWDNAKNDTVFGKCANPYYHGHNYEVEVKLVGEIDDTTGYVMDLKILSDIIKAEVVERFDHRNLNEDCIEFKNLNPTAENIVTVIYDLLAPHIPSNLKMTVRLYETKRNFVEYPA